VSREALTEVERAAELPVVSRFVGTRRNEGQRQAYANLEKELEKARRELYKGKEFRRFALGVNAPAATYTVNGIETEIATADRVAILRATTPLLRRALSELTESEYYVSAGDAEKRRMIETLRTKIQSNVRQGALGGGVTWSEEDMPRLVQALAEYREYNNLPVYLGMTEEQEALVRMANARVTAIRRANPSITLARARVMAAQENPEGVRMAMIASKRRNPARKAFWAAHPYLSVYFGDLTLEELGEIGVTAPATQ
jgi:hypothetical protein